MIMKTYYAVGVVTYLDDSDEDEEPYSGKEVYSVIFTAKDEESAKKKALKEVMMEFKNDAFEEGITKNIKVVLDEFYETSEDARR